MWLCTALPGVISLIIYIIGMIALYISPLTIKSPCIIEKSELPSKPFLLAHRGASAVSDNSVLLSADWCLLKKNHSVIISASFYPGDAVRRAGLCESDVSVHLSVCPLQPVLYQNGKS